MYEFHELIHKCQQGFFLTKQNKKLGTEELLVDANNSKQAANPMKCIHYANIPVSVSSYESFNKSRGIISKPDLYIFLKRKKWKNTKNKFGQSLNNKTLPSG